MYKRGHPYPGLYLQVEGGDGSGKSTQFRRLNNYLETDLKISIEPVVEPGGTEVGEQIRRVLLDPNNKEEIAPWTEAFLFMASRNQLAHQRIIPALKEGKIVVSDRGFVSSYTYQGFAGGLPAAEINTLNRIAMENILPDRIFIFDASAEVAFQRMNPLLRPADRSDPDRIELKGREFHEKVRTGYHDFAIKNPEMTTVIDTNKINPDQIFELFLRDLKDYVSAFPDLKERYPRLNQNP